jgi:putative transposase
VISTARSNDKRALGAFHFKKGDVVVFDRGYTDYQSYANHCRKGVYFVTRLKNNAQFRIVERRSVKKYKNILSDHTISFTGYYSHKKCPMRLRKIRARDPETGKTIVILTNQFEWSPQTIAAVYKDRWQIEIFFVSD